MKLSDINSVNNFLGVVPDTEYHSSRDVEFSEAIATAAAMIAQDKALKSGETDRVSMIAYRAAYDAAFIVGLVYRVTGEQYEKYDKYLVGNGAQNG